MALSKIFLELIRISHGLKKSETGSGLHYTIKYFPNNLTKIVRRFLTQGLEILSFTRESEALVPME